MDPHEFTDYVNLDDMEREDEERDEKRDRLLEAGLDPNDYDDDELDEMDVDDI